MNLSVLIQLFIFVSSWSCTVVNFVSFFIPFSFLSRQNSFRFLRTVNFAFHHRHNHSKKFLRTLSQLISFRSWTLKTAMDLQCEFHTVGGRYTCFVSSAAIPMPERNFYEGDHPQGKCDEDVTGVYFIDVITRFPQGLHEIFPNTNTLWISKSRLKEVSRENFDGLENLTHLYLIHNRLKSLPSDLFVNMRRLQHVSFNNNKIEFISSEILRPLKNLEYFGLEENKSIDVCYQFESCGGDKVVNSLQKLMTLIDQKCSKPRESSTF